MYRVEAAVSTDYQKPLIMTVDSEYTAKMLCFHGESTTNNG